MRSIEKFKIDEWIRDQAPKCDIYLHGSYASALSVNDLQSLSSTTDAPIDQDLKLTYGLDIGSLKLRERLAEIHSSPETKLTADNVVITPGSIMANYLVLTTLCGPGDHVICQYPTFGQLYLLPRYNGIELSLWKMKEENQWTPSVEELVGLIKPNTKAIILKYSNPSNPTGTVLSRDTLEKILDVARKANVTVMSDEVFAPLFHGDTPKAPPLVSLGYSQSVSTGSVSKAHGLPGIRVGWVVSPNAELLERVITARDYTTSSVSQLDDGVASFALSKEVLPNLMRRNLALCQESLALIEKFVKRNSERVSWIKPAGAGTAFLKVRDADGNPVVETDFCTRLAEAEALSLVPGGYAFQDEETEDFKGYVRITLGDPGLLKEGLVRLERFMGRYFES